ncbi:MAG: MBL fold metallo-hydrolase [Gammaproteobacteria bacterium]|nr:MBL fold metallo-hydrolase [Gammaproteobacteria bacterium]
MNRLFTLIILAFCLLASCANNPHYDASKPHHTKSGFKNIYYQNDKGLWDFIKWRWERLFKTIPDASEYDFKIDTNNHQIIYDDNDQTRVSWIGHATFLIQFSGLNILTDPQFSDRSSPVSWAGPKRVVPPAIKLQDLPEIDVVIISHDHYDSLDVPSIIQLARHNQQRTLTFIVPLGLKAWFDELDLPALQVVELDWSNSTNIKGVTFTAEPAQHWSKRSLFDTFSRLWASWVIAADKGKIFFAGDTGYAKHFKQMGDQYQGFDLALLPIGAYEPRWFMQSHHVNPDEAVQIHKDIRSEYSIGMHWGTFILTDEPLTEPPLKLAEALNKHRIPASAFEVYRHGETRNLEYLFN